MSLELLTDEEQKQSEFRELPGDVGSQWVEGVDRLKYGGQKK